jgi:hypothetical protein
MERGWGEAGIAYSKKVVQFFGGSSFFDKSEKTVWLALLLLHQANLCI